ncbi:hypothetical protein [Wielerella bovis]|uniref:hypothetical protein n=1 Tax=Wielerella bovis TaxID=2917790 RepID=UPI0020199143|nr:hypothetical protein [Wielerella bovis]MCG7656761.1 hypothetical protein [Wielerella bovis]MCG7658984.1 hypothetical protein [Wielerella bovis]
MKRTHFLMIGYLLTIAALFVQSYCERQSLQYFDFKAGLGDNQAWANGGWHTRNGLF